MQKYVLLDKKVGETPLQCAENWRKQQGIEYENVPLSYAGRLDPMASGKLLILIGDECKQQEKYHGLDKEYEFEVLFAVQSDTADVLGLLATCQVPALYSTNIKLVTKKLTGTIELPYPHFSSKTVKGKPLHTWTLEGRLSEIEVPTKRSTVHSLHLVHTRTLTHEEVYKYATEKIETIPKVTDERKAIGNDFRRDDVRSSWKTFYDAHSQEKYTVAKFRCIASSGTYMRTLAEVIAKELGTCGLAFSIHRTKIGVYRHLPFNFGFWKKLF